MTRAKPEVRLERILLALGMEVAEATDEEVLAAAADLAMKPMMKGTVAFLGLKLFVMPYDAGKLGESDEEWSLGDSESGVPPPWRRGPAD